jgi:Zn finger protein HypA/HybF involved in hydrogenase expression
MAGFSKWECESCDFKVETSGFHEFYRDDHGELRSYGHPTATSKEVKEKGVKGFFVRGYCTKCNAVKVAITQEFNSPIYNWHLHISSDNEVKSFKPICSECGTELILDFFEKPCPKCGNIFNGIPVPEFS